MEKKYIIDNEKLMSEWDWDKNNELGLEPSILTEGSNKKAWWVCGERHEWLASIHSRNSGSGCPYCSGRFAIKGKNDLQTVNPALSKEWNYDKNRGLSPSDVLPNSGKKVWWRCNNGHEWHATICSRNNGIGCPYCSGKRVLKGFNDLQTVNPNLAKEWNYDKNGDLRPDSITANNGNKVWWRCIKGHEWQAKVYHRNNGSSCPICMSERNTSLPEFALVYYLKTSGVDVIHSYKVKGYELDVFIPSKMTAIEYDGYFWHKNKTHIDLEKNRLCNTDGIKLYRIRGGLPRLNDSSLDYVIRKDQKDLPFTIETIISEIIGTKVDVDLKRDAINIENMREYTEKENSIIVLNPKLAKEWNYEKNGNLKPEFFAPNSGKKVWWKCNKGHEWQAVIQSRNSGIGCPYCNGKIAIKGENDLQTVNPELAKEWNYEKNNGLTPSDVLPNSEKLVWWKCNEGHEWQAIIGNRNKGRGCPYCSGKRVIKGVNDLKTVNPTLSYEWNYNKNFDLSPTDVLPNSNKKVWWKCNQGHEWEAKICDRNKGSNCPYCTGRLLLSGFNDLLTKNPELSEEWNYEKNNGLKPSDVFPNSSKKVWWRCKKCGYEWIAYISNRNRGNSCPKCSELINSEQKVRRSVLKKGSLCDNNPTLSREWHPNKNGDLTPDKVTANSSKKVWWICSNGHEWEATVAKRNAGSGCPYCNSRKVLEGFNDLFTVNPELSTEWNYEKNDGLAPSDVLPNSNKKVWWKCKKCGYEWDAVVCNRNKGHGCPKCAKKKAKR